MASTSVHLPKDLLTRLDRVAKRAGTSRNGLIVRACRTLVDGEAGEWPPGFFSNDHLSAAELRELRTADDEMSSAIRRARKNRRAP